MQYAVIRTGGKQYRVAPGDILEIDKLDAVKDGVYSFNDVLLVVSDGKVTIGTPLLSEVKVKAKVLDQIKGEKIRVAKFKSKVRYRRVTGFRARLTRVQIEKIESGSKSNISASKQVSSSATPKRASMIKK